MESGRSWGGGVVSIWNGGKAGAHIIMFEGGLKDERLYMWVASVLSAGNGIAEYEGGDIKVH